jgi:hypothetical protein
VFPGGAGGNPWIKTSAGKKIKKSFVGLETKDERKLTNYLNMKTFWSN